MFVRTARLICDRCKSEVDISPRIESPFEMGSPKRGGKYDGWAEIGKDTHLCPVCHAGYVEVENDNRRRIDDYLAGR